jgi:thermitase
MRSSLLFRLLVVFGLIAIVGVPSLSELAPGTAEAQTSVYGMPVGDVWSGVMAAPEHPSEAAPDVAGGQTEPLIVRFRPRAPRSVQVVAHQSAGARRADALALSDTVRVEVPAGQTSQALAAYAGRPDVLYAEPDYEVHTLATTNDPQFPNQWALQKVGAPTAWDVTRGSPAVKVAVVDCGIVSEATGRLSGDGQAGHPDLRGKVALNQDFTSSSTGFDDYCNHGTHVAGIIAANGNNGIGISGLASNVTLINAKVLNDSGSGSTSNILNGVIWAVQSGAKVVNLSLGRDGVCSQSERDTFNYAFNLGVVVVAAAGNSNLPSSGSPANCDNVVSVASTTNTDARSSFSNYGASVDVAAPGSAILSTIRTGEYDSFSGTSMASPHVAALAGLIWSQGTATTAQAVIDRIRTTADPITGTGTAWAWGRINAAAALQAGGPPPASSTPTATTTPTATPTQAAVPTRIACPSPRPPVRITTSPVSQATVTVTVRTGAGVIREIGFRDLRNAAITIGSQSDATSPFTYRPNTYISELQFSMTRPNPAAAWTVSLAITDDCGVWTTFVGGGVNSGPHGSVTGTVRNSTTNQPISGATVAARENGRSATTNASGTYTIVDLPVGSVTLDVSASGYAAQTVQATIQQNLATTANISLVAAAPPPPTGNDQEIKVSLTWGVLPLDLDAHISGPMPTDSSRFHLYWNNANAASHATISGDDNNGLGPETITIKKNATTGKWVAGEYRVWAHNYSGTPNFAGSTARVTVTRGSQQLGAYNVSDADGSPNQSLWRSITLTIDANGNVTLSPIQQFTNGGSSTVLRVS